MSVTALPPGDAQHHQEFLLTLQSGRPLIFILPDGGPESADARLARTVPAALIASMIVESGRTITTRVEISGGIIEGPLNLPHVTFAAGLKLTDCEFTGPVDFSFSVFERMADFSGSKFDDRVLFRAAHVKCDLRLDMAVFVDTAMFSDLRVDEVLEAGGTTFGDAHFYRAEIMKRAAFRPFTKKNQTVPTRFKGEARFGGATFQGNADFQGVEFENGANFDGVRIARNAYFHAIEVSNQRIAPRFAGPTSFYSARIGGDANFRGAKFEKKLNLSLVKVDGALTFRSFTLGDEIFETTFDGEVSFYSAEVRGDFDFNSVQFKANANFSSIKVQGTTGFCVSRLNDQMVPARFGGQANFFNAQFKGNVDFRGSQFADKVQFDRCHVSGNLLFRNMEIQNEVIQTRFMSGVRFFAAHIEGDADFQAVEFGGKAVFNLIRIGGRALFQSVIVEKQIFQTAFRDEGNFTRASIQGDVQFSGTLFKGRFLLDHATIGRSLFCNAVTADELVVRTQFEREARFVSTQVQADAEFNGALFRQQTKFDRISIGHSAAFSVNRSPSKITKSTSTRFYDEVSFIRAHIQGDADFRGAQFDQFVSFETVRIHGAGRFRTIQVNDQVFRTTFGGKVTFYGCEVSGELNLNGVYFAADADFTLTRVDGEVRFAAMRLNNQNFPVQFRGQVTFFNARFQKNCYFPGAEFQARAVFDRVEIGGNAAFRSIPLGNEVLPCVFRGQLSFVAATLQWDASFEGAQFHQRADFSLIKIGQDAWFRSAIHNKQISRTMFHQDASFMGATVQGSLHFNDATFRRGVAFNNMEVTGDATFKNTNFGVLLEAGEQVDFEAANFASKADFSSAIFCRDAVFDRVEVSGVARFQTTKFRGRLSLRDAKFHIFVFDQDSNLVAASSPDSLPSGEEPQTQFNDIDLRGFSYDTMNGDWRKVFTKVSPYARQPFSFLEKTLRSTGNDREADDAYLMRRKHERKWIRERVLRQRKILEIPKLLFDGFQWLLFNYGVRPYGLLLAALAILLVGVYMFSQPNAVKVKPPPGAAAQDTAVTLSKTQALGMSLRLFSPIEIASGSEWVPTQQLAPYVGRIQVSYAGYASFHRLAGFVLVPIGVLVLGGLLRRQAKP